MYKIPIGNLRSSQQQQVISLKQTSSRSIGRNGVAVETFRFARKTPDASQPAKFQGRRQNRATLSQYVQQS